MNSKRLTNSANRLRRMHDALLSAYGPQGWWPAETPFEVVLGAYLTQNTSWKAVQRSLGNLRTAGVFTIESLRQVTLHTLQELIRPSGFVTRKAPALKAFVAMLDSEFQGSLDLLAALPTQTLRIRLLALPSVGPETADAILLYALGHAVPVADEYLRRIADRHKLLQTGSRNTRANYEALTQLTRTAFALDPSPMHREHFGEFHALVVAVGKLHCRSISRCDGCPLAADLPLRTRTRLSRPSGV